MPPGQQQARSGGCSRLSLLQPAPAIAVLKALLARPGMLQQLQRGMGGADGPACHGPAFLWDALSDLSSDNTLPSLPYEAIGSLASLVPKVSAAVAADCRGAGGGRAQQVAAGGGRVEGQPLLDAVAAALLGRLSWLRDPSLAGLREVPSVEVVQSVLDACVEQQYVHPNLFKASSHTYLFYVHTCDAYMQYICAVHTRTAMRELKVWEQHTHTHTHTHMHTHT